MRVEISEEQELLRHTFAQLFEAESSPDRVRAAEPLGFDPGLWKQLAETGALGMRVPESADGGGASLLDACLVAEQAGRRLASGPLVETVVVARLLALLDGSRSLLAEVLEGQTLMGLAHHDIAEQPAQQIAGGGVAQAVLARDGEDIVIVHRGQAAPAVPANLSSSPLAVWTLTEGRRDILASGPIAVREFERTQEEWKLLTAASLVGLAREALEIAGRYATERIQFDRPIGAFQGIAHPLADSVADVEGARLLVWKTVWSLATGQPKAAALISMSFVWAAEATSRAIARALHTHGGYGLSLEYDIQLYHRRGKALPLCFGDPQGERASVADRLWGPPGSRSEASVALPDAGEIDLDFTLGEEAEAFAATARKFFEENLTDELRAHAHFAWEGHHPGFQRQLAEAGLLYPSWPKEVGGQGRGPYDMAALSGVFSEFGWTRFAISTTGMVAQTVMKFGSPELVKEVVPRIARGDAISSLGYTEPGSGSDVAAAQTRAQRDGEDWVINGQKMFTSGANLAQYVFLLTRTNPEAKKHKGLTMFLVPLETPGIEIQPVHTLSDEQTNITYYSDVRIPDRYRVGEVDGGWAVIAYALELEHGAGFGAGQHRMLNEAVAWARQKTRGTRVVLDDPVARDRLARVAIHAEVSEAIGARTLYVSTEGLVDPAIGPLSKYFSTDRFVEDSADLMDLCAPDSLLTGPEGGAQTGAAAVEFAYRLSTATAIYGGTSEIMKSIVAQVSLGMPRSRS